MPVTSFYDKVLQKKSLNKLLCNTLSGVCCVITNQDNSTYFIPFYRTAMLDDRTTRRQSEIFNSVGSSFPQRSRILQQFHPQWRLVYTASDPSVQQGWSVVLPRYWFLPCRHSDQHFNQPGCPQSGRNDCGSAWRKTPLPMSFSFGSVISAGKTPTPKVGTLIRLHRRRSADRCHTAPSHNYEEFADCSAPCRDYSPGFGGVYPQSRVRLRAVGSGDLTQKRHYRCRGTDRKDIRNAQSEKKDGNCAANAMQALKSSLEQLSQETLPSVLFPQPPVIRFTSEKDTCLCRTRLIVQKTRNKTVLSMNGPFIARETLLQCPVCSEVFASDALLRLVQRRCNIAYDVLVFVGQALFQRYLTTKEVRAELVTRNVYLSASEIGYLGRKYIKFLAVGHRQATPRIRHAMKLAGGYILHLDATHDGDAPALMTGMDDLSKIVLANVKLPSENSDHIVPFLRRLLTDCGTPQACVHDMGTGICKAVGIVFPGIPDVICHFHFLRDIGKDFLEPAYSLLRKRLRHHAIHSRFSALVRETRKILIAQNSDTDLLAKAIKTVDSQVSKDLLPIAATYSFALWALRGRHSGNGYGFPFDRPLPEFAERLTEPEHRLSEALSMFTFGNRRDNKYLSKLSQEVSKAANDFELRKAVEELRWRCRIFDRLRNAMRIAPPGGGKGLNDDGTPKAMSGIRRGVEKFRCKLDNDHKLSDDHLIRKMAKQIDKYGDKLFADPIEVNTPNGTITVCPQRTNNILEQLFRGVRRGQRRKTGNGSMCRTLQTMLADTPLVKNLNNPEYMKYLLNGKDNLEELFAELGTMPSGNFSETQDNTDRILPGFRTLTNLPNLPELMIQLLTKLTEGGKSN